MNTHTSEMEDTYSTRWNEFLSVIREDLKKRKTDLVGNEEQMIKSRSIIVDETKRLNRKYKKSSNEEDLAILQEYKKLIKLYQNGIDELTQYEKNSNSFISELHTNIESLPDVDPTTALPKTNESSKSEISLEEYELLSDELEKCQRRIMELERSLADSSAPSVGGAGDDTATPGDNKIVQLEQENSILLNKVTSATRQFEDAQKEILTSKHQNEKLQNKINQINEQLAKMEDYDSVKNELETLRKNEYGITAETVDTNNDDQITLLNTNKSLQTKLAEMRVELQDLRQVNAQNAEKIYEFEEYNKQLELEKSNLERDLENLNDVSSKFTDTQSIMSSSIQPRSQFNTNASTFMTTSSIIGDPIGSGPNGLVNGDSSNGMLQIIKQQRDRFRNKNVELEKQIKVQTAKIQQLSFANSTSNSNNKNKSVTKDLEQGASNRYRPHGYYDEHDDDNVDKMFQIVNKKITANKTNRRFYLVYFIVIHLILFYLFIVSSKR